eukprot:1159302-Pelagomonas_calceolata.AAC.10
MTSTLHLPGPACLADEGSHRHKHADTGWAHGMPTTGSHPNADSPTTPSILYEASQLKLLALLTPTFKFNPP